MSNDVRLDRDTGFAWPVIDLDREKLIDLYLACRAAHVGYRLGAKAAHLNARPGEGFKSIDCSGFVRWLVWNASTDHVALLDGSVQQHEQIRLLGFKPSSVADARREDNVVRAAFLSPLAGGGVGHVALIWQGKTIESCGAAGPSRRPWNGLGWQGRCKVYALDFAPD